MLIFLFSIYLIILSKIFTINSDSISSRNRPTARPELLIFAPQIQQLAQLTLLTFESPPLVKPSKLLCPLRYENVSGPPHAQSPLHLIFRFLKLPHERPAQLPIRLQFWTSLGLLLELLFQQLGLLLLEIDGRGPLWPIYQLRFQPRGGPCVRLLVGLPLLLLAVPLHRPFDWLPTEQVFKPITPLRGELFSQPLFSRLPELRVLVVLLLWL